MTDEQSERLKTIIDEAFGLHVVMDTDTALTTLERELFEQRRDFVNERTRLEAEVKQLREQGDGWVSVGERLPSGSLDVLVWDGVNYGVCFYDRDDEEWCSSDVAISTRGIRFWRPLPEPPGGGE